LGSATETFQQSGARPLEDARGAVSEAYDYTQQLGRSMGGQSKQLIQDTNAAVGDTLQRVVKTQPFAVALAGLAAGAAVAAVFPMTQVEKQAFAPAVDKISESAQHLGSQIKDAAGKAGEKLTELAEDRGLNSEGIKSAVGEVAGSFRDSLSANKR
jgi:hypothetical protein